MAVVLRQMIKKNEINTLRKEFVCYQGMILGIALIMNIAALFVLLGKDYSYSNVMRQVVSLNSYYMQLEKTEQAVQSYVANGDKEAEEAMHDQLALLSTQMDRLKTMGVSVDFQRNIADIAGMQEKGMALISEIEEEMSGNQTVFTKKVYGEIQEKYEKISDIYARIDGEFKQLHLQLLSFASGKLDKFVRTGNFYYLVFAGFLSILMIYGIVWGKYLRERIVTPVQILTRAAEQIRDGKLFGQKAVVLKEKTCQEISVLVYVFNKMVEQMKEKFRIMEEDARTKVALREQELENLRITNLLRTSELRALQRQMNPHFLFNTMNMIAKNAYMEGAEKTVDLLQRTAYLLRYSLDYMDKAVTLDQEIEILGDYVYLQEQRFGKRIRFRFELDERFHQTRVPCLILQPLVENSIIHGVGSYVKDGQIVIKTQYLEAQKEGLILISDNGEGIPEKELEALRKKLSSEREKQERVGLANVYQRLTIFFEGAAEFEIESRAGEGTQVLIRIPVES